jgi:choline dehydrogenase-like flavoprotein
VTVARADALDLPGDTFQTELDRFGRRAVFAEEIPKRLALSSRTTLVVEAPASRLQAERARNAVAVAVAGDGAGARFGVRARAFVLAAGAIETARLLLLAGREPEPRLVIPDSAGRCFMDHFYVAAGRFRPPDPRLFNRAGLYDLRPLGGTLTMGKLRPTEGVMRQRRLLSGSARLEPELRPERVAATRAAAALIRALRRGRIPGGLRAHLGRIVPGLGYLVSVGLALGLRQRSLTPVLCPGWSRLAGKHRHFTAFRVVLQAEQAPCPDNRVVLSDRTDAGGRPLARLRTGWSAVDLESIAGIRRVLADSFARAGWTPAPDAVAGKPVLVDRRGAHHHLGTTRMHVDPRRGAADETGRVHGVANLFVAGGALFPSGGSANPTLTIVALALRLADHLKSLLHA